MRLQLMSWPEVESHLRISTGVIVPAGATEQHGPTGLVGTDAICAETLAVGVAEAVGAVAAPVLSYGMSEHHMGFPGSVSLRPSTLVWVVRDVVLSLARHGFRRVFFVNGHGGNTPSLQAGFFEAYAEAPTLIADADSLRCAVVQWWECEAARRLSSGLFGGRDGDHASASEVSIALAVHPDAVTSGALVGDAAASGPVYGPQDFRRRYPDGRMGSDPSLASARHGIVLRQAIVADLAQRYQEFLAEA